MNRVLETFACFTNLYPVRLWVVQRGFYDRAKTYLKLRAQTIAKLLRFTGGAVGCPLNFQPMLVRPRDELNWSVRI